MSAIVCALVAVWLVRAAINVAVGVAQIALGVLAGVLSLAMLAAAEIVEIVEDLWQLAKP